MGSYTWLIHFLSFSNETLGIFQLFYLSKFLEKPGNPIRLAEKNYIKASNLKSLPHNHSMQRSFPQNSDCHIQILAFRKGLKTWFCHLAWRFSNGGVEPAKWLLYVVRKLDCTVTYFTTFNIFIVPSGLCYIILVIFFVFLFCVSPQ